MSYEDVNTDMGPDVLRPQWCALSRTGQRTQERADVLRPQWCVLSRTVIYRARVSGRKRANPRARTRVSYPKPGRSLERLAFRS
jgi:hypothetical protein